MLVLLYALAFAVADASPAPLYQIDVEITDRSDAKTAATKAPKMIVADGQQATIKDEVKRAFVTAVRKSGDAQEPVIKVVHEGVTVSATPTHIDQHGISLDLVIRNTRVKTVGERLIDDDGSRIQLPTVESTEVQASTAVRLGEQQAIHCGDRTLTFVVCRFQEKKTGQSPLNAVDVPSPLPLR
jgi:hypothetical protein